MPFPTLSQSPAPTSTTQVSGPTTPTTALLSCVSCRARKIKCSKTHPVCSGCQRSNIDCVYPARTRLPRGKQGGFRARNVELSRRLNRLESLVGKLGVEHAGLLEGSDLEASGDDVQTIAKAIPVGDASKPSTPTMSRASEALITSNGTRYLSGDFWASLSKEVDGLKQLLNDPSNEEDGTDIDSPESTSNGKSMSSPDYGPTPFIFGGNAETRDLSKFHPPSPQMTLLCETYFHRCDPLFKVLHKPTMTKVFATTGNNLSTIESPGVESVMFAIYYVSITSLQEDECFRYFREEKDKLLRRYKYATEIALSKADFLNSMELEPLQAFTIYLTCSRWHSSSRDVWALSALALRIAQALDLPRDGLGHNIRPFEAEMRRRLWWQVSNLDTRGSEDRGTYPMILENTFTTRRPLNINDTDIDCNMEHEPEERIGFTDLTFCLISCEAADLVRRLNYLPPKASDEELEAYCLETERIVEEVTGRFESKYLTTPSTSDMYKLSSMVIQVCKKKCWLCCQYPLLSSRKTPRSNTNREEILSTAIWILEFDLTATGDFEFLRPWIWYSKVFVQWHPLAVALVQLCLQTTGPNIEHAWSIVEKVFDHIGDIVADNRKGTLWKPIKSLLSKAQAARAEALRKEMMTAGTQPERSQNLYQDPYPAQTPQVSNPEVYAPPINSFGLPLPMQGNANQEIPHTLPSNFIPDIGEMNIEQQQSQDAVNWTDWCEFVSSTWDSDQAVQGTGGNNWNPQFGFWSV